MVQSQRQGWRVVVVVVVVVVVAVVVVVVVAVVVVVVVDVVVKSQGWRGHCLCRPPSRSRTQGA